MAIFTERECGHVVEEGTRVCPECGYDPDCVCCYLYGTGKEEEECLLTIRETAIL